MVLHGGNSSVQAAGGELLQQEYCSAAASTADASLALLHMQPMQNPGMQYAAAFIYAGCMSCKATRFGKPPSTAADCNRAACRSTELLSSVQQHMRFNHSTGSFTVDGLVAYVSATEAIRGQGWKARATMFLQLMAPRYTMLPIAHDSLKQQMRLLALAAADLPAVGRMAAAEVSHCRMVPHFLLLMLLLGTCCSCTAQQLSRSVARQARE